MRCASEIVPVKPVAAASVSAPTQCRVLLGKAAPSFMRDSVLVQATEQKVAAITAAAQLKAALPSAAGVATAQRQIKKATSGKHAKSGYYDTSRKLPITIINDPRPTFKGKKLNDTLNEQAKRFLQDHHKDAKKYTLLAAVSSAVAKAALANNTSKIVRPGVGVSTLQSIVNTVRANGLDESSLLAKLNSHATIYRAHLANVTFIASDFTAAALGIKKTASADKVAKAVVSKLTTLPGRLTRTRRALEDNFTELAKHGDKAVANTHCGTQFEEHVGEFHILGANTSQIVFSDYRLKTASKKRRSDRYVPGTNAIYECKKFDKTGNTKVDLKQAKDYALIRDKSIKGPKGERVADVIYVFSNKMAAKKHTDKKGVHKLDLRKKPYKHKVVYLSKKTNTLKPIA